jgi:hypothetical protein
MNEHITIKALRAISRADSEARAKLAADQMNLILRAARLAGRHEVTVDDLRAFDLTTRALDTVAGNPAPETEPDARASDAGLAAVSQAVAAE